MSERVQPHSPPAVAPEAGPLGDDAFETSRLLLELIHASHATRRTDGGRAGQASSTAPHGSAAASSHAIRAAIHVYQHGERTIGELAAGLGISYGWASRVVSELEAAGTVARRADPDDRRVVHVALTPESVEMVESAYRWRGDAVERALAGLDADGRRAVMTFLRRVTAELEAAGREGSAPEE